MKKFINFALSCCLVLSLSSPVQAKISTRTGVGLSGLATGITLFSVSLAKGISSELTCSGNQEFCCQGPGTFSNNTINHNCLPSALTDCQNDPKCFDGTKLYSAPSTWELETWFIPVFAGSLTMILGSVMFICNVSKLLSKDKTPPQAQMPETQNLVSLPETAPQIAISNN